VSKTLLFELPQNRFERSRDGNNAMPARLGAPRAIVEARAVPGTEVLPRLADGEAARVQWLEMPPSAEFEQKAAMPEAQRMAHEVRDVAEP